jgi:hypothetical protein
MNLERTYRLPFGYEATFSWQQPDGLNVSWTPGPPAIRKLRPQRKFFEAYKAARRQFFEEVAAIVGGNILIIDSPDLQRVVGSEVIDAPTRH